MGFKNLFVKDDGAPKPASATETKKTEPTVNVNPTPVITPNVIGASGVVDNKFVEMLMQAIAENNQPGLDYFEFKQSIDAMASLPIDENNKILSTYAILSSQGCTKDNLIKSLDIYIGFIQNERANFDNELKNQYNLKVNDKLSAVESAKAELEKLNLRIREVNEFIITSTQEIQQEEAQLKMTADNFNKSVQLVLNNLENDKTKINTIIK